MAKTRVLVVDDQPYNIQIVLNILSEHSPDFVMYQANNVDLAVRVAQKVLPDLIITDWDMPEKDGIDLIKCLKQRPTTKYIPIIMATGVMTSKKHLRKALKVGAVDYIRKPIDEIELIARVESAIRLADSHKLLIKQKNNELLESTLLLIKNNEFTGELHKKLERLIDEVDNDRAKHIIKEISDSIAQKIREDERNHFDTAFNAVYDEFYKNLLLDFPTLTQNELKLCAFLKLGLCSKDIASVLYINKESVKVARSRLRKKLKLTSSTNLQSFLAAY